MNIFKKLFGKRKNAEKEKEECWYNNAHENGASVIVSGDPSTWAGNENSGDCALTKTIVRR